MRELGSTRAAAAGRFARREVLRRRLPHGVIHWRYLTARPPEPLGRQKAVWKASLPALPRPAWAVLEAALWLRWTLVSGPAAIVRALRRSAPLAREEEGIGLPRQAWRVGMLALGWSLPPSEIYRHRLYRADGRARAAGLVFDHAAESYRSLVDDPGEEARRARALLADKLELAVALAAHGVPVPPAGTMIPRGSATPLRTCMGAGQPQFGKPRHGSASAGAFRATLGDGTLTVQPLTAHRLTGEAAEGYWRAELARDDMLLQPMLSVDPALVDAASAEDIVTVRCITQRSGEDRATIAPWCAMLELPDSRDTASGCCRYVILPVELSKGTINPFPETYLCADARHRQRDVLARLGTHVVPGWATIAAASVTAHRVLPGLHAIGWDWAITAAGPLLLEGNAAWGVATPQQLTGGLFA